MYNYILNNNSHEVNDSDPNNINDNENLCVYLIKAGWIASKITIIIKLRFQHKKDVWFFKERLDFGCIIKFRRIFRKADKADV